MEVTEINETEADEQPVEDYGIDQIDAEAPGEQEKPEEDVLDILQPKAEPRTWIIGKENQARQYVQRPLSFISKMQWFALVGEVVDKAMSGPDGLAVSNLFSTPSPRGGSLNVEDFADADTFVQAVGKLLVHAPDFLEKSYCIWLGIPDYEWDIARHLMALPPEEGGLTDEQGMEIIEVFIDQNWAALESFFRERLGQIRDRVAARQKDRQSQQSRP